MRYPLRPLLLLALASLAGCATPPPPVPPSPPPMTTPGPAQPFFSQTGIGSFYGAAQDGRTTADGESFDPHAFTAAHRTLAFGTVVRVTNLDNGRMVKVEINDRGPRIRGRIVDLSAAAAQALGMEKNGISRVRLDAFREDQSGAG